MIIYPYQLELIDQIEGLNVRMEHKILMAGWVAKKTIKCFGSVSFGAGKLWMERNPAPPGMHITLVNNGISYLLTG